MNAEIVALKNDVQILRDEVEELASQIEDMDDYIERKVNTIGIAVECKVMERMAKSLEASFEAMMLLMENRITTSEKTLRDILTKEFIEQFNQLAALQ